VRIIGNTAWVQRKTDFRLTVMVRPKSALGEVVDAPDNGDAGVVDENVDRPELGVGAFDHLRDRARFRDIRADRHRLAACAG
jgi:hypothetical protein